MAVVRAGIPAASDAEPVEVLDALGLALEAEAGPRKARDGDSGGEIAKCSRELVTASVGSSRRLRYRTPISGAASGKPRARDPGSAGARVHVARARSRCVIETSSREHFAISPPESPSPAFLVPASASRARPSASRTSAGSASFAERIPSPTTATTLLTESEGRPLLALRASANHRRNASAQQLRGLRDTLDPTRIVFT